MQTRDLRSSVLLTIGVALLFASQAGAEEKRPARVGQIFIIGNEVTRQDDILDQLDFYPGQMLSYDKLRRSAAALACLGVFEGRPAVHVLDPETPAEFKDIVVSVREKEHAAWLWCCRHALHVWYVPLPLPSTLDTLSKAVHYGGRDFDWRGLDEMLGGRASTRPLNRD
jgi:hypothetical protein